MFPVTLVYSGFLAIFLGAMCLTFPIASLPIPRLALAVALWVLGAALSLVGRWLPTTEARASTPKTRLDEFVPAWQFREVHSTRVRAARARVYQAIRRVTASEILFFSTLTRLRRLGRRGPEGILNPAEGRPLLDIATRTTFALLADESGRELVVGTLVLRPNKTIPAQPPTPEGFKNLDSPGFAKAALNFTIDDEDSRGCRLTTETRVYATDPRTRRRFAAYWRFIYPGSSLLRRMWLRAIRRRAEA